MVYKQKLIAAIKVNNKTLKENGDIVEIPFKSEYSIYLKNLETRKCKIEIIIDGSNVGNYILDPLSKIDLERFNDSDRKFKFIAKTKDIEEFRGNEPEDGLIEIKYSFEKQYTNNYNIPSIWKQSNPYEKCNPFSSSNRDLFAYDSMTISGSLTSVESSCSINNIDGITVEGSKSDQKFINVPDIITDECYTIIFKLIGSDKQIITKKSKKQCSSCGKKWKAKYEYCPNDGTYLK